MDKYIYALHLKVGKIVGKDKTCGNKIDYKTEETAIAAAVKMNQKQTTRNPLEAYPCGFCDGWHIGREMKTAELESYLDSIELSERNIESQCN